MRLRQRHALEGALAGLVATLAMTAAMRRLHRRLPEGERYPLPPREITDRTGLSPLARHDRGALANHFAFGAGMGALYGALCAKRSLGAGVLYGLGVWSASYLGWIPGTGILRPATSHPIRRNALMLFVHVVWGVGLTWSLREMEAAEAEIFTDGWIGDRQRKADLDRSD